MDDVFRRRRQPGILVAPVLARPANLAPVPHLRAVAAQEGWRCPRRRPPGRRVQDPRPRRPAIPRARRPRTCCPRGPAGQRGQPARSWPASTPLVAASVLSAVGARTSNHPPVPPTRYGRGPGARAPHVAASGTDTADCADRVARASAQSAACMERSERSRPPSPRQLVSRPARSSLAHQSKLRLAATLHQADASGYARRSAESFPPATGCERKGNS
jgi:hypothetical protein